MNYRIETREAFRIIGVSAPLEKEMEKNFMVVPKMWEEASVNGTIQKLAGMMDTPPMGLLGVSACNDEEQWKYFIAVSSTKASGDFEEYTVPASTWAIFSGTGTNQSIQELEQRIITEWLPTSGYEYANAPDIEVYLNPDPQNAQYEVWIPVAKKKVQRRDLWDEKFSEFMEAVDGRFSGFVNQINEYLTEKGCKCDIKLQKSGYVVSYTLNGSKRTLATFVSRKMGMKLRIYPEHIQEYQSFPDTLQKKVKEEIKKASACKPYIKQFLEKELQAGVDC